MLLPAILTLSASLITILLILFFLSPLVLILPIMFSISLSVGNYFLVIQELRKQRRNLSDAPHIILFLNLVYFSSLPLGLWLWGRTPRGFDVLGLFSIYSATLTLLVVISAFFLQKNWSSASGWFKSVATLYFLVTGIVILLAFLLLSGIL